MEILDNTIIEAIKTRRSARRFKEIEPERKMIEEILEASTWAPNHHLTEPWRFVVVSGEERIRLGNTLASGLQELAEKNPSSPLSPASIELEKKKPLQAPTIICMICSPNLSNTKVVPQEEIVACGAALQNMLLAIHSRGLGTWVKTGASSYSEAMKSYLRMSPSEFLIAMVYVGYVAEMPPSSKRMPITSKVIWLGST